ncbi:MAG: glycosyltransferase family 4 protein [Pseudomonadota bacterium]|nr:glycosyltransferase family 4 protein [Pseudomonadota bacterium]
MHRKEVPISLFGNALRILFVCKRYYTGKDVILHRFGRLYELPVKLASLGHQVTVLCLDYRGSDRQMPFSEQFGSGSVCWFVVSVRDVFDFNIAKLYKALKAIRPQVVVGSSDIPCLWFARRLAKRCKIPYAVDLYDNYESFGQAVMPGFRSLLKLCVRDAGVVIVVSTTLKEKVLSDYMPRGCVVTMNNGVLRSSFCPGDGVAARRELQLPLNARLIGTAGNLSRMKGLDTVYDAWSTLEGLLDDVYLVLAGPIEPKFAVPRGKKVIYLGELLEPQVGQLFRALDVGIVPAHDSEFGRYCFPQKLFEMVACGLPVVGADVGAIGQALHANPEALYIPGDVESLVGALRSQLEYSHLANIKPMEWSELVESIEPAISRMVEGDTGS